MALITCPECGNQVSDKADKCPNCAYPINSRNAISKENESTPPIIVKSKEGCFLQTMNVGCMIIGGIILLVILAYLFSC